MKIEKVIDDRIISFWQFWEDENESKQVQVEILFYLDKSMQFIIMNEFRI
jgi:hypothetical protein